MEITNIQKERKIVTLKTICTVMRESKSEGSAMEEQIVIDGEAVIFYPHLGT